MLVGVDMNFPFLVILIYFGLGGFCVILLFFVLWYWEVEICFEDRVWGEGGERIFLSPGVGGVG
ncbi:MAG: hypothetical protein D6805_05875 [Planctomycetota bacterium]|nr:MAG: hypothetical protein D6805_05875 [Planctomycetota bacterium]